MRHQHPDRLEVLIESGGPQAVIGIAAALEQMLREGAILAPRDREPERRRLPVVGLSEGFLVEAEAMTQNYLGGLDAGIRLRLRVANLDAASQVQPVAAALVAIFEQRGVLLQRAVNLREIERLHQ